THIQADKDGSDPDCSNQYQSRFSQQAPSAVVRISSRARNSQVGLRLSDIGREQVCPFVIPVPAFLCHQFDWPNEPVPPAGDCLNETRCLWVVAKYITDLADGGIHAVLGVEKDILTPETIYDFLTRYQMPLFFEEEDE